MEEHNRKRNASTAEEPHAKRFRQESGNQSISARFASNIEMFENFMANDQLTVAPVYATPSCDDEEERQEEEHQHDADTINNATAQEYGVIDKEHVYT
jgi:hypothetical protein